MQHPSEAEEIFLSTRQVRTRYGNVSEQSLWRWLRHETMGFPKPIYLSGRRYWKLQDLTAWERTRAASGGNSRTTQDETAALPR